MYYKNIKEEELKNRVGEDYFNDFDYKKIIGNIDFCITLSNENSLIESQSLLWAEAKRGSSDIFTSISQLILTIGKARTFDDLLPPAFLGAFDAEKIAFIPYNTIQEVFYQNDFNWNVAPSNYETKEFKQLYNAVKSTIEKESLLFFFERDDSEIEEFIEENFIEGRENFSKVQIDKNNFLIIYNKWLKAVKPTIAVNWEIAKKNEIFDADFYLADLLSKDNKSLKDSLYVILEKDHYELAREINEMGFFSSQKTSFLDKQKAHREFWNKYQRPPKEEYWDYIIERRDLLVPQDIRERKGSFFTPQIWVELSQKYLADILGEDWQDEYYIWDCAAGTGNLLAGLREKHRVWASTLDRQDVDVMKDRIQNGANLLESHVFQFDFLNDSFDKLPKSLKDIIDNSEKRKKLVIYINPPYVEGDSRIGRGRKNVQESKIHNKYQKELGKASGELYAQFFMRIYKELQGCILGQFSKLKHLQAPNFLDFRNNFEAKLEKMFIVPADTFDNVKGKFPIGFFIWNTNKREKFKKIKVSIYDKNYSFIGKKVIYSYDNEKLISTLIEKNGKNGNGDEVYVGNMSSTGNDFQNQNAIFIEHTKKKKKAGGRHTPISQNNLIEVSVYYTVRKVIPATWLNDREQFLFPHRKWQKDIEFQNDCLTYVIFNNNIQSEYGTNHWIPFREKEVNAKDTFESTFMIDFIEGKIQPEKSVLFKNKKEKKEALIFSPEAQVVFDSGRELWKYYHSQANLNLNASLYDIRMRFQGKNKKGRMNPKSDDEIYTKLINDLRDKLKVLAKKIEPKVYEYGFLKK